MRRFSLGWIATSLGLVLVGLLAAGCGSGKDRDDEEDVPRGPKKGPKTVRAVEKLKPVTANGYGTIEGKVIWKGDKPDRDTLTQTLRTSISKNSDQHYCMKGKTNETSQQEYRIGTNDGL